MLHLKSTNMHAHGHTQASYESLIDSLCCKRSFSLMVGILYFLTSIHVEAWYYSSRIRWECHTDMCEKCSAMEEYL
jgi:hypothetical protein